MFYVGEPVCRQAGRDSVTADPSFRIPFPRGKQNCLDTKYPNSLLPVGEPGFEPGVTRSQTEHVSRYTTPRMQGANVPKHEAILAQIAPAATKNTPLGRGVLFQYHEIIPNLLFAI